MKTSIASFLLLAGVSYISAAKLPKTFTLCKKSGPGAEVCLRDAVEKSFPLLAKGIPSLGLPPLDPLVVSNIQINQGTGSIRIKMEFFNMSITGLAHTQIPQITNDLDGYRLTGIGVLDEVVMQGDYVMDGNFLVLPVKGQGKAKFRVLGIRSQMTLAGQAKVKKGQTYFDITKFSLNIEEVKGLKIQLDNLFNGDKQLGDSMNQIMNENWREFWGALKPDFEVTFASVCNDYAGRIFGRVPYKDIFLS